MATSCLGDSYVSVIDRTECIGNSLATINNNFYYLDKALCDVATTASSLNNIKGIIKGDGAGTFIAADPKYDYYVPGQILYSDFNCTGKITTAGGIIISAEGSNLVVERGNISGRNITLIADGNFGQNVDVKGSLTVGGAGTFDSITTKSVNSTDCTITGKFTAGSINATGGITAASLNVTGSGSGGGVTSDSLEVKNLTITANGKIAASGAGIVSDFNKTTANISVVQDLSAWGGKIVNTSVDSLTGSFNELEIKNTINAKTLNVTTQGYGIATINECRAQTLSANILNLNDVPILGGTKKGSLYTNVAQITSLKAENLALDKRDGNGVNIAVLEVPTVNTTYLSITNQGTNVGVIVTPKINGVAPASGGVATLNWNPGQIDAGSITSTGLIKTSGTVEGTTKVTGKRIEATGTTGIDGVVSAENYITAPTVNATTKAYGPLAEFTTTESTYVEINGTSDALKFNSPAAKLVFSGTGSEITMNQSSSKISMTGTGSEIKIDSGTITAGTVNVNTSISCKGDITAFGALSDKRLKKEITNITNALDKVSSIRGVEYIWDTELQDVYKGKDSGVIAQEVEEVFPVAVIDRDNGYKAVKYERLIPLLIESIKELKNQNEALKNEINELKAK